MKKKVLILTYYWPPSGGAGVQRWLRFVKNLRDFDWEPTIYTAKNTLYPVIDEKLEAEIPQGIKKLSLEVPEPNNFLNKVLFWKKDKSSILYKNQQQSGNKKSITKDFLWWIRGNFFIPDARFLWISPSVKYLKENIKKGEYDVIVSTGPPHSLHLIAKRLKDDLGIPWIADFRDPWTSMDYLNAVNLTSWAQEKHNKLEKKVVTNSDKVIVVGQTMANEFKQKYAVNSHIIHNGYNDFKPTNENQILDSKFSIVHIGSFLVNRNCDDLWEVLSELALKNKTFKDDLKIKLIGNIAPNVLSSIEKFNLNGFLEKIDYIKYEKTIEHLNSAQVLLLPIDRISNAEFVITGKIFEYLKANRPILLIGPPNGDAANILNNCEAGYCCDFDNKEDIKKSILEIYTRYKEGKNYINSKNVESYSGYELSKKLSNCLDQLVQQ